MTQDEAPSPAAAEGDDEHGGDGDDDDAPAGPCCWYWKHGRCEPPRPPCRFRHDCPDDGAAPCCFGAACRLGHARRVTGRAGYDPAAHWGDCNNGRVGACPAARDAALLRSQLEPWPTAALRGRLATVFGEGDHRALDPLKRGEIMRRLLGHYEKSGPRKTIRVLGTPVDPTLCDELLKELKLWRTRHTVNTRPSINAESYMILRSPNEFRQKQASRQAELAARKLAQNLALWRLAGRAIRSVDPGFARGFSALAVTHQFRGSPHIDRQNTGPFYGLALGDFPDGRGGVCVEADARTVAHCNTKNRLAKVDGRYPHWVAPYDDDDDNNSSRERYSLIFYSTRQDYQRPGPAFFGEVVDEADEEYGESCKESPPR